MLTKRIIPCLDCDLQVPEGRVVKGVEFKQIKYAGNPVDLATRYYEEGADEVVVLDITASHERRATMADVIDRLTENVFMPICVGGGIRKVDDYIKMLKAGADKCSTNTAGEIRVLRSLANGEAVSSDDGAYITSLNAKFAACGSKTRIRYRAKKGFETVTEDE